MSFAMMRKLLLLPFKRACDAALPKTVASTTKATAATMMQIGAGGQLQQIRHHMPIAGPPRFPLSTGQRLIMGWGSILAMMIIPFWALSQMPRWSKLHNGIDPDAEERERQELLEQQRLAEQEMAEEQQK
ncbi:uncharacterized protein [Drosophila tropicalis]|uniref:uncharacterized protein n=1 Tax=Drosophila tropicalis TaxID=46794 RepID=UPI0035AB9938